MPHLRKQSGEWVDHCHLLKVGAEVAVRGRDVHHRRAVEPSLDKNLPDRLHVAIADVQRREEHPDPGREHDEPGNNRDHLEPADCRRDAAGKREHDHGDEVHSEVERRRQRYRQRDHHPWEPNLAKQRLTLEQAGHAVPRRLGEVVPQHDPGQQVHAVMRNPLAYLDDLREEQIQHPEEQQRPHQRPDVAEDRAEVAQLELGTRERRRQLDEPSEAASESRMAHTR